MLPIAVIGMVLRTQAVGLLFNYGRFSERGVELTAGVLLVLLIALPPEAMIAILARAFYANRDTVTPVVAAILAVLINVTFGIVAVTQLGLELPGIALGIALGAWAEALLLVAVLDRRMAGFRPMDVMEAGVRSAIGAVLAGLTASGVLGFLEGALSHATTKSALIVEILVAGGAGGLVYLAVSLALRIPELTTIVRLMSDALPRPGRP